MGQGNPEKYKKICLEVFKVAAALCLLIFALFNFQTVRNVVGKVAGVLTPVWIGIVLCFLANPLYRYLRTACEKKKLRAPWPKVIATVCATLAVLGVTYGLFALILPQLYESLMMLYEQAPVYLSNFEKSVTALAVRYPEFKETVTKLYESLIRYLETFVDSVVLPNLDTIATSVFSSVKSVAVWIYNLLIGLVVMVYLLNVKDEILPKLKKMVYAVFRPSTADELCSAASTFTRVFGGYISGKLLDSLIIGILCFIFMTVANMPYNFLISMIIGLTNVIPYLGPFIGAIPSSLLIFLIDPKKGLIFVIFILALQQLDGNVIGPKILGQSTGISSFWILVSVIFFGGLFGLPGMLLAVPLWATISGLVNRFAEKMLKKKGLPCDTKAYEPGRKVIHGGDDPEEHQQ